MCLRVVVSCELGTSKAAASVIGIATMSCGQISKPKPF
jgi:hypothetical protein